MSKNKIKVLVVIAVFLANPMLQAIPYTRTQKHNSSSNANPQTKTIKA